MKALDEEKICRLYCERNSAKHIAELFNVSINTIIRTLHRNNISVTRTPKYTLDEDYFLKINCAEKAYILGLLYSDGGVCINNNSRCVKLTLQKRDSYILDIFNKLVKSNRPIYNSDGKYPTLQITNKKFVNNLIKLGVIPNKTLTIKFPTFITEQFLFDFIRGVFDGDGYFYFDKNKKRGTWAICGNYEFCMELYEKLYYFNLNPVIYRNITHKNTVEVRIHGAYNIRRLYDKLYCADLCLARKRQKIVDFLALADEIDQKKIQIHKNITALHAAGKSVRVIAEELSISKYSIDKYVKDNGLLIARRNKTGANACSAKEE
jgi:transposase